MIDRYEVGKAIRRAWGWWIAGLTAGRVGGAIEPNPSASDRVRVAVEHGRLVVRPPGAASDPSPAGMVLDPAEPAARKVPRAISKAARRKGVDLVWPRAEVHGDRIIVPPEATEDAGAVVAQNLSIWSPFEPGEVHVFARSDGGPAGPAVAFALVPRSAVAAAAAVAARFGLEPDRLLLDGGGFAPLDLDSRRQRLRLRRARIDQGLAALAFVLALGVVFTLATDVEARRQAMEEQLRSAVKRAEAAANLRRRVELSSAVLDQVAALSARSLRVGDFLAEVDRGLADGVRISSIRWPEDRDIRMTVSGVTETTVSTVLAPSDAIRILARRVVGATPSGPRDLELQLSWEPR